MIVARGLTKRYSDTAAVDDLSFEVRPGVVTGFLGPNGAGKSTTMRLMLDLDYGAARPGSTAVGSTVAQPMREIGTVLESGPFHPTRRRATTCGCWPRPAPSRPVARTRS